MLSTFTSTVVTSTKELCNAYPALASLVVLVAVALAGLSVYRLWRIASYCEQNNDYARRLYMNLMDFAQEAAYGFFVAFIGLLLQATFLGAWVFGLGILITVLAFGCGFAGIFLRSYLSLRGKW